MQNLSEGKRFNSRVGQNFSSASTLATHIAQIDNLNNDLLHYSLQLNFCSVKKRTI